MKNRFAIIALFASIILPLFAYAQAAPPTVNMTDTCSVVDTAGTSHTYNQPGQFLGICVLSAAKEQGAVNAYTLQNFSFGLFLQSLNGTAPSPTQFWNLYQNGTEAAVGLSDMIVAAGDTLKFQLTDFTDNSQVGSPIIFQIGTLGATPAPAPASPSSRGGGLSLHAPFDVPLALDFLARAQRADGSFDSLMLSDWAAIAFAGGGAGDAAKKLAQYFSANPPVLPSVTDNERHAMALESLGINPYSGTSIDYIAPIVASFDGEQIGDQALVNDDIFALFPLSHAGYTASNDIIIKTVAFIVSQQKADGSWTENTDMTAAGLQALKIFKTLPGAADAIAKAVQYLRAQQQTNGGFGNSFSTSWALQAISATSDSGTSWSQGYSTPQYYLATLQQTDGGVEPATKDSATRAWATAYAIPAIGGKTWDSLLSSFFKPTAPPVNTATSTVSIATSTPEITAQVSSVPVATVYNVLPAISSPQSPESEEEIPETQPRDIDALNNTKVSSVAAQTAAVISSSNGGLFSNLWTSITSFFRKLF